LKVAFSPRVVASAFAAVVAEAASWAPAVTMTKLEGGVDVCGWDGSAGGLGGLHLIGVAVRVGLVAEASGRGHAFAFVPFVVGRADVAIFVDGVVGALVEDVVGEVLVVGLVALSAACIALVEALGDVINDKLAWLIVVLFLLFLFLFIFNIGPCDVVAPLKVANFGGSFRAGLFALVVRSDIIDLASVVCADSHAHAVNFIGKTIHVVIAFSLN